MSKAKSLEMWRFPSGLFILILTLFTHLVRPLTNSVKPYTNVYGPDKPEAKHLPPNWDAAIFRHFNIRGQEGTPEGKNYYPAWVAARPHSDRIPTWELGADVKTIDQIPERGKWVEYIFGIVRPDHISDQKFSPYTMREGSYASAKHEFDADRVVRHPQGHRGKGPFVSTEYWITAQIFATDVASKLQKSLPQLHKEIKQHWGGKPSHGGPDNSAYYPYPVKEYCGGGKWSSRF